MLHLFFRFNSALNEVASVKTTVVETKAIKVANLSQMRSALYSEVFVSPSDESGTTQRRSTIPDIDVQVIKSIEEKMEFAMSFEMIAADFSIQGSSNDFNPNVIYTGSDQFRMAYRRSFLVRCQWNDDDTITIHYAQVHAAISIKGHKSHGKYQIDRRGSYVKGYLWEPMTSAQISAAENRGTSAITSSINRLRSTVKAAKLTPVSKTFPELTSSTSRSNSLYVRSVSSRGSTTGTGSGRSTSTSSRTSSGSTSTSRTSTSTSSSSSRSSSTRR